MAWTLGRIFLIAFILECTSFTGIIAAPPTEESGTQSPRPLLQTGSFSDSGDQRKPAENSPGGSPSSPPQTLSPVNPPDPAAMKGMTVEQIPITSYPVATQTNSLGSLPSEFGSFLPGGLVDPADLVSPWAPPQSAMSRELRKSPTGVQYIGKDGTPKSGEAVYEEILQDVLKDPPSLTPTAVVRVIGRNKKVVKARILLDTGAQGCSISNDVVQRLQLSEPHLERDEQIRQGVGGFDMSTHKTTLQLCSRFTSFCLSVEGGIKDKPIGAGALLDPKVVQQSSNIELAEDGMPESKMLDIVVGVDYFEQVFLHEAQHIGNLPTFYNTNFGWMAFGKGAPGFKYMVLDDKNESQLAKTRTKLGLA